MSIIAANHGRSGTGATREEVKFRMQPKYRHVGEIMGTNRLRFRPGATGICVAMGLLSSHVPGAPVIDDQGKFMGFISEFDVLKALRAGKDLKTLTAEQIMAKDRKAIDATTPIEEAVQMMEDRRLLNLPVEENGVVTKTVTRHDLLRAWLGQDLGVDF